MTPPHVEAVRSRGLDRGWTRRRDIRISLSDADGRDQAVGRASLHLVADTLTDILRAEVDTLGQVACIIAPNSLHHLFLVEWKSTYPGAKVYAPPGLRTKRKDIAFDADLGNASSPDWAGEIDQVLMQGNLITTEVVFFHVGSGTVLFTDLIQQFPVSLFSSWRGLVAKLDLMTGPEPSVPRKFRIAFTNRRAARDSLQRIFAWPAERVLMAHGTPVEKDAQAFLRRAFRWLAA